MSARDRSMLRRRALAQEGGVPLVSGAAPRVRLSVAAPAIAGSIESVEPMLWK